MKKAIGIKLFLGLFLIVTQSSFAQCLKSMAIDSTGQVTDETGKLLARVNAEGTLTDPDGIKIAHLDTTGSMVDEYSGLKLGKKDAFGNFKVHYIGLADDIWIIYNPVHHECTITDLHGIIRGTVHERFKAIGTCSLYWINQHRRQLDKPADNL